MVMFLIIYCWLLFAISGMVQTKCIMIYMKAMGILYHL